MKSCECGCGNIIKDSCRFCVGHARRGRKNTEKHKKALSLSNIGRVKSQEEINKIKILVKKMWDDEKSIYHSDKYKNNRIIFHKSRIGKERKEETKDKLRKKQIDNWKNKDHIFNSLEFRNKLSLKQKSIWKNSNSSYNSEDRSNKISNTMKELYKTDDYTKKLANGLKVKPNRPEKILIGILSGFNFKYVGNYKVWIGGKNPDFLNEDEKLIIEHFGWRHTKEATGIPDKLHENDRIVHFENYGYRSLIIWEYELKNLEKLRIRITNFIGGINE